MKILIQKQTALELFQPVQQAISDDMNVRLEAKLTFVVATAVNTEIEIRNVIELADGGLEIIRQGNAIIEAYFFKKIVHWLGSFPNGMFKVEASPQFVVFENERARYRLALDDQLEIYDFPKTLTDNQLQIPSKVLRELISSVSFAAAKKRIRSVLSVGYIEFKNGQLSITACDSHRLATRKTSKNIYGGLAFSMIVSIMALDSLRHVLPNDSTRVVMRISESHCMFQIGSKFHLLSKATNVVNLGVFFSIPSSYSSEIIVNTKDLIAMLGSMHSPYVRMTIMIDDPLILISSPSSGSGRFEVLKHSGNDIDIHFNPRYVLDALRHLKAQETIFRFNSPYDLFAVVSNMDVDWVNLIWPIVPESEFPMR